MELSEILLVITNAKDVANKIKENFTLSSEDPLYVRRAIFMACAFKLSEQAKALKLLAEADLKEEAVGMSRIMVEVVINAIYLQFADESEVSTFMRFDTLKISRHLAKKAEMAGDGEIAKAHEHKASMIAGGIGKTGDEFSWCKKSMAKRASAVDEKTSLKVFVTLQENSSMLGNLPLHGSFMSMMHLMPSDHQEWPHRDNFCREGAHLALNALRGFAYFAEEFFPSRG